MINNISKSSRDVRNVKLQQILLLWELQYRTAVIIPFTPQNSDHSQQSNNRKKRFKILIYYEDILTWCVFACLCEYSCTVRTAHKTWCSNHTLQLCTPRVTEEGNGRVAVYDHEDTLTRAQIKVQNPAVSVSHK